MEQILNIMLPLTPIGVALMACVAFGFALSAREALGRERGLRAAAERARDAALKTLATNRDWEIAELGRFRRLLDCHIDAIAAEATEFVERPVPSPGRILEELCGWHASWRRDLARVAELKPVELERLLKDDLPITPLLARRLEAFTGAPARYWEHLYRLVEHRAETAQTVVMRLGDALQLRERSARVPASTAGSTPAAAPPSQGAAPAAGRRPKLEIVADGPPTQGPAPVLWAAPSAAAGQPASSGPSSSAPRTTSKPPAPPPVRRSAAELPSPVVPHPGLVARESRGALPPPPRPRLRPASSPTGIAATLTDFPIQREGAPPATASDWADIEHSPLNSTLPGVGSGETSA
ncbi:helix-turn-helix transcriptional regulator [Sorangium sp. So ce693]|uniref:helix-turn-helix transcriptional regulator n=1 Tax=Sorangium sp. So ce693 TaxID=3133318 RepID=UPI003F5DF180